MPTMGGLLATGGSFSTPTMLTPSSPRKRRIAERAGGTAKAMPTATAATTNATASGFAQERRGRTDSRAWTPGQRSRSAGRSTWAARPRRSRSSSAILLLPELCAQPLERSREPRLDRAAANPERGRGLLLREVEEVPVREYQPVALAEPADRCEQLLPPLRVHERRLGGRGRVPRGRVRRSSEREPLPPPGRAAAVPRLVCDDPEQPRPKRRACPEAAERAVRLHEPVLRSLLRVGLVAGDEVR